MKKISNFCMLLLLLCTTFFVFNVNYTREVVRIQEMGKTVDSLDLYLKDINEPAASVLRFFEDVSKEYKVSIIKTDSGDEVIKSGVFDKDTFPYQEFGISSLDFTTDGEGVYSNKEISNKLGTIPTFLKAKPIQLMTFQTYIKDTSRSLNGRYTITSTQEMDKDRIVQKWSDFFKLDQATLLEPTYKSAVEVINRDLLLSAIVFVLAILLLVLVTVYQPMMEMKRVGVQKLLGFQDRAVLADVVKAKRFIPNVMVVAFFAFATLSLYQLVDLSLNPKNDNQLSVERFFIFQIWSYLQLCDENRDNYFTDGLTDWGGQKFRTRKQRTCLSATVGKPRKLPDLRNLQTQ